LQPYRLRQRFNFVQYPWPFYQIRRMPYL
jgi:hypothetical protein